MRLCFIANGQSIHTRRWVEPLIARGDEIHLFSYVPVKQPIPGLQYYDLTQISQKTKIRFIHWGLWLRHKIKEIQPDILHCHQIQAASWLGSMTGFHPIIVTGWGSDVLIEPNRSWWRRYLSKWVLHRADCITVPSPIMRDVLLSLGVTTDKLRLIPWGIDQTIFTPFPVDRANTRQSLGISAESTLVLSPRSLTPVYNHDVVLHAFHHLTQTRPQSHLLFLLFNVEPAYQQKLEQFILNEGLQTKISWLAPPDEENMAQLYRAADMVISIPSSEGYGATVYEAMACGCPTIVSDLPIFSEGLLDNQHTLKVDQHQIDEVAQAMVRLSSEPTLQHRLRQNGYTICDEHSVSHRIALTTEMYEHFAHV